MNKGIILADCLLTVLIVSLLATICFMNWQIYKKYEQIVSDYKIQDNEYFKEIY